MARSHVIYVVVDVEGLPQAAFTVRHEMASWAAKVSTRRLLRYLRLSDGWPAHGEETEYHEMSELLDMKKGKRR